ncbi:MAG: AAA family ATPase [Proteobacteria bacterium]|nr:AAA family ATPase [Pseudomonadota bacterium]
MNMEIFGGYLLNDKIHETRHSVIYRGHKEHETQSLVIKILKTRYPTPSEIARFRQDYLRLKNLDIDGIIRTIALVEYDNRFAIIEEAFDGIPLSALIRSGTIGLKSFLSMAGKMAETLTQIHGNSLIHMDIKPDNILVSENQDTVKITNFGFIGAFTHSNDELFNPEFIEGTLPYMSPEQTGRMNRSTDYRTDFYSLGITWYEMLTGEVPFASKDPMELIHAHIARNPVAPERVYSAIPRVVSSIVMKLLAKNPEERYQNSTGLAADIDMCRNQLSQKNTVDVFPIATRDIPVRFNIPQLIVGRENEIQTLLDSFDRVTGGKCEMVRVLGHPGIGKSALINEIHKPIVAKRGYFISGKYDQFRRDVPYSAIIQAFQGLLRQIIAESEDRVTAWKSRLLDALGPNGKVVTQVIPELELVIGVQPDVPEHNPEESQNRFNLAFKNFIHVFSTQEHPLTLFIDDVQWADMASQNLIKYVITHPETRYLLLICAYRDNEVSPSSPLEITLSDIIQKGITVNRIHLEPLNSAHVNKITMELLRCDAEISMPLADLIHKKTAGNPFFVSQFLKNIYDTRLLEIDPKTGWTWDLNLIQQMRFTDNVVEFLAQKISGFTKKIQEILMIGACIGSRFDIETLAMVSGKSLEETLEDLTVAIHEDLIGLQGDSYTFYHDRIQEAAYSLIPENEKRELHYRIGHTMLKKIEPEELNEKIFYVVNQINSGLQLVTGAEEKITLAQLNLSAAQKAKRSTAYASALIYLKTAEGLLPGDAWDNYYDLTYSLHREMIECFYLNLNFSETEKIFKMIMQHVKSNIERANIYSLMVVLYTSQGDYEQALRLGYEGMRIVGFSLPEKVSEVDVLMKLLKFRIQFGRRKIEDLIDLPPMTDPSALAYANLAIHTGTVSYYSDSNLFAYISIMGASLQLKYGTSEYGYFCFIIIGSILGSSLGFFKQGFRFGETALKLSEKLVTSKNKCQIKLMFAFSIQHWTKHAKFNLDFFRKSYKEGLDAGDLIFSSHSVKLLGETRLFLGHNIDELLEEYDHYRNFQMESLDPFNQYNFLAIVQVCHCLKGLTDRRGNLDTQNFKTDKHIEAYREAHNLLGVFLISLVRLQLNYLFGHYSKCPALFLELDELIKNKVYLASLHVAEANYYTSLAIAALYPNLSSGEKRKYSCIMGRNQSQMKRWSKNCPENFEHKYLLVEAERARLKGKHNKALSLYDRAIRSAHDNGYLQNEAMANELAARLMLECDHIDDARHFMKEAHYGYIRWGATAKAEDLAETYPDLFNDRRTRIVDQGSEFMFSRESGTQTLDLSTIIKAFQSLSSEIDLGKLLVDVLTLSIENAGAQKGFLVLENEADKKLYIEARGGDDQGVRVLNGEPLQNHTGLSVAIVNFVARTKDILILNHAAAEGDFTLDPYVVEHQSKSIICHPVIRQSRLVGVLYLENNITIGAFTPQRIRVLDLLASQAAISIENARLYEHITQAREHLSHILETANEGFWRVDNAGITIDVNPEMCTILGRPRDNLVGHPVFEFWDKQSLEIARRQKEILRQHKKCTYEATLHRPDGSVMICQFNATLLHGNEESGSFAMVTDITKRKQAEQEILKLNAELEQRVFERTQELNRTLEKVEAANAHTQESIRYAKMIQQSLLPNADQIKTWLPDSFVIWEPRDIIGGDFFYAETFETGFIIGVMDCTGHGVPGAFMTIIAATGLRRIINDEGCRAPGEILKRLNVIVKKSLQQDTGHALSDDGLDAGICFIDAQSNTLTFAGARIPLIITDNGALTVIKGDKQSIGYVHSDLHYTYNEHRISIGDDYRFYLATDGFSDQMGGEKGMRFSKKRFHNLLQENCQTPFDRQQEALLHAFQHYQGDNSRQDDVTVVGFNCNFRTLDS